MYNTTVLIKQYKGVPINYQRSGRYEIKLCGRYMEFDTVAQAEGMITAYAKSATRSH